MAVRRGFLPLALCLALFLGVAGPSAAQERIPGLFTTLEEVEPALRGADTRDALLRLLGRWSVCTSDDALADALRQNGVRALLVPLAQARPAVFSGECDLHLSGQAAGQLLTAIRPGDDVDRPADREGPTMTLRQREFAATSGSARIIAGISDPSGVAGAEAESWQGVQRLSVVSGNDIWGGEYRLPPHYRPERLILRARDRLGNLSEEVVILRRLPACGSPEGITRDLVRRVQEDLNAIGRNAGAEDGYAGERTCRALAEHGIVDAFDWGDLTGQLALDRITLKAPERQQGAQPRAILPVEVSDPRGTGAVWRIQMLRGGRVAASKPVGEGRVEFAVTLVAGAQEVVRFRAVDAQGRALATAQTTVARTAEVRLRLTGEGYVNGTLSFPEAQASLRASIIGLSSGRIAFRSGTGQSGSAIYSGTPVSFDIAMPEPGARTTLGLVAIDEQGEPQETVEVTLFRVPVTLSVTPGPEVTSEAEEEELTVSLRGARPGTRLELREASGAVLASSQYRDGQSWTTRVRMPPAGQSRTVIVAALDSRGAPLAAPQRISLVRPGSDLPPWLIPTGIGAILVFGMLGGLRGLIRRRRARRDKTPAPEPRPETTTAKPPPIRVTAVPDDTPEVAGPDAAFPALTLRAEPDMSPEIEVILDEDEE